MEVNMIVILILIILALVGYILWLKKPKRKKEIDTEEIEKQKEAKKAFDNLMKYDFEIAIRRK